MKRMLVVLIVMMVIVGCASSKDERVEPMKIDAEEAKSMMTDEVLIVDVRTKEEYDQGYIPDAILLPLNDISDGELTLLPDKDQTILLYCRSGNRSGQAANILADEGYTAIYDFGGIKDWPYEIVK